MLQLFIVLLINIVSTQDIYIPPQNDEKRCRVLSMSGGGSKGAYEAGAVYALMHNLTSPEN